MYVCYFFYFFKSLVCKIIAGYFNFESEHGGGKEPKYVRAPSHTQPPDTPTLSPSHSFMFGCGKTHTNIQMNENNIQNISKISKAEHKKRVEKRLNWEWSTEY